jgi:siroheme synthase (precorrin-2 oxidase/ferrochelatase)
MLHLLFATAISLSAFTVPTPIHEVPAAITAAASAAHIDVLEFDQKKSGSDVSITAILQVDHSIISITSTSHSYVEAIDQLKRVFLEIADK